MTTLTKLQSAAIELTPPHPGPAAPIRLDGGKHSFAHSLACAALADAAVLDDVPDHIDARALRSALALIFDRVEYDPASRRLTFAEPRQSDSITVDAELVSRSRSLFGLYPAMLTRARQVRVAGAPTGCAIGSRPHDWYLDTLRSFGVQIEVVEAELRMSWPQRRPAVIELAYPSMTGTVIAIAAAAATPGRSFIGGLSVEPSCADQLDCLRAMGGVWSQNGDRVEVTGSITYPTLSWPLRPDRIHAVTYLTAGLIGFGRAHVVGRSGLRIPRFIEFLRATGCEVLDLGNEVVASLPSTPLTAVSLRAGSEPLFSSDWVPAAALLLAMRAQGASRIVDDVFTGRLQFLEMLREKGLADFSLRQATTSDGRPCVEASIQGRYELSALRGGDYPVVPDIRGSVAIALAAATSGEPARVLDDFQIGRGHTDLAGDLRQLGFNARRVPRPPSAEGSAITRAS